MAKHPSSHKPFRSRELDSIKREVRLRDAILGAMGRRLKSVVDRFKRKKKTKEKSK